MSKAENDTAANADCVIPFHVKGEDIRGQIARLDNTIEAILAQRDYPPLVEKLLAEAVLLTAVIAASIKLRGKISLQIRGKGAVRLLATDFIAPKNPEETALIRGYASFDSEKIAQMGMRPDMADCPQAFGQGYFAILIDQGPKTKPFQGLTALEGKTLAQAAQAYFRQSEQILTAFRVVVHQRKTPSSNSQKPDKKGNGKWSGAAVMVQKLPDRQANPAFEKNLPLDEIDRWETIKARLSTISDSELTAPMANPQTVLARVFAPDMLHIFAPKKAAFGCTCSEKRVRQSLSIYSQKDILHMIREDGKVGVECQFCGRNYEFLPHTLGFEAQKKPASAFRCEIEK